MLTTDFVAWRVKGKYFKTHLTPSSSPPRWRRCLAPPTWLWRITWPGATLSTPPLWCWKGWNLTGAISWSPTCGSTSPWSQRCLCRWRRGEPGRPAASSWKQVSQCSVRGGPEKNKSESSMGSSTYVVTWWLCIWENEITKTKRKLLQGIEMKSNYTSGNFCSDFCCSLPSSAAVCGSWRWSSVLSLLSNDGAKAGKGVCRSAG